MLVAMFSISVVFIISTAVAGPHDTVAPPNEEEYYPYRGRDNVCFPPLVRHGTFCSSHGKGQWPSGKYYVSCQAINSEGRPTYRGGDRPSFQCPNERVCQTHGTPLPSGTRWTRDMGPELEPKINCVKRDDVDWSFHRDNERKRKRKYWQEHREELKRKRRERYHRTLRTDGASTSLGMSAPPEERNWDFGTVDLVDDPSDHEHHHIENGRFEGVINVDDDIGPGTFTAMVLEPDGRHINAEITEIQGTSAGGELICSSSTALDADQLEQSEYANHVCVPSTVHDFRRDEPVTLSLTLPPRMPEGSYIIWSILEKLPDGK